MGRIYLVRHGEASGDETDDPGLSERGRSQAHALSERLSSSPITQVWHGPRRRTTETAEIVAGSRSLGRCSASELLDDRTPVPSPDRLDDYPQHRRRFLQQVPPDERDEDGADLSRAWIDLSRSAHEKDVLLVTHAFVIAWFVKEVLGAPAAAWMKLAVENTGLSIVSRDGNGNARLEAFNETAHLKSINYPPHIADFAPDLLRNAGHSPPYEAGS